MLLSSLSPKRSLINKEISNIVLLSTASCISLIGTSIYNFAIGLYVLRLTGSGLSFATTLVLGIISAILVNPFAGALADRLNKKILTIVTDTLNGLLLIGIYLLTTKYTLNLPMIYVSTLFLNIFTTIYGISIETAKPNLVSSEKLLSMNSISKIIDASSSIIGPMLGGIVFAFFNIRVFILINGFSFILSALLHLFIDFKFNYNNCEVKDKLNLFADILEGIKYLKDKKNIISMFGIYIALNFFLGLSISVPMPYIINNVLKLNAKFFGIIEAAFPVGMICGALIIKKIMGKYSYTKIIKFSSILLSACMAAIGISVILNYKIHIASFYLIYYILITISAGTAISFIDIPIFYILQQTIPDNFRGRVLSLGISIAKMVLPFALIMAGALINIVPTYTLSIVGGVGLCIFSILYIK
ncbi:MFS transporter [Clostridium omnivorum]|uniref:MFS transporter n=1 Tax=Clostridium omnivorum TaxID=1604902 RepID=A0ABQ5N4W1_9CLOT|nr:MFS transporter [Clostridium sp. E14]GLC30273.1 MFS transporter [Clostridium sp. E14]